MPKPYIYPGTNHKRHDSDGCNDRHAGINPLARRSDTPSHDAMVGGGLVDMEERLTVGRLLRRTKKISKKQGSREWPCNEGYSRRTVSETEDWWDGRS